MAFEVSHHLMAQLLKRIVGSCSRLKNHILAAFFKVIGKAKHSKVLDIP